MLCKYIAWECNFIGRVEDIHHDCLCTVVLVLCVTVEFWSGYFWSNVGALIDKYEVTITVEVLGIGVG